jgi:hypothetical protein
MQSVIPPDTSLDDITQALRGRWFGSLHWWGIAHQQDQTILKWVTSDGGLQVDAQFTESDLTISASLLGDYDRADAIHAAYQLLSFIAKFYAHPRTLTRVAYWTLEDPTLMLI